MYKGIFWILPSETDWKLKTIKVECDSEGTSLEQTEYSSKSGENFNHKAEWAKMPKSETNGFTYNYYPRGRVEIKDGKVRVFVNNDFNTFEMRELIKKEFGIKNESMPIRFTSDGSYHYRYGLDVLNEDRSFDTPHYGQIVTFPNFIEKTLGDMALNFARQTLYCIAYGPKGNEYKLNLLAAAMDLRNISRYVAFIDGTLTKPDSSLYEEELFTAYMETEDEVKDHLEFWFPDCKVSSEYVFKCLEAMKPLIIRWVSADYEMLFTSEYAYLIDYVIRRKGDVPYPAEGLFPKNFKDFNYIEGIAKEFTFFN